MVRNGGDGGDGGDGQDGYGSGEGDVYGDRSRVVQVNYSGSLESSSKRELQRASTASVPAAADKQRSINIKHGWSHYQEDLQ
ncbi:unnamed protein product [Cylicostephanus goldi]|uniref:Uncharacterized protein n=1 Tax=Cylicostephanus goldi TaxID=71465 RepID=A0A3P6SYP0_CYLGO|nr:unnamed protein product [Cylicostephanus goldi]